MTKKYTFAQMEKDGIEAVATFDCKKIKGWIMNTTEFVHYANDAQQVRQITDATDLDVRIWSFHGTDETWLHAVIRFKKTIQFPRYLMNEGDRWGFVVYKKRIGWVKAIESGERFVFAGGDCLAEDVEIVYIGTCDIEYSLATGHIKRSVTPPQTTLESAVVSELSIA